MFIFEFSTRHYRDSEDGMGERNREIDYIPKAPTNALE